MKVLGVDIGGSAVKGAPVETSTGRLLADRLRIATPDPVNPDRMAELIAELKKHFRWRGPVGVGFPGVVQGARILTSANLHPDFVGCEAGALFRKATRCPVAVTNDAAAAAMAEMRFGAGKNFSGKVLILTLGTGVGSALAYDGVVVPCEFGHLLWKGKDAEKLVAASVRERKDLSWKDWAERLDAYIRVLEDALWPELIIIGGGVSSKHHKFFPYLNTRARLVPAGFFNHAGIVGAALWGAEARARTARSKRARR